ncbi:sn-glycerol-3-phosphate import ATP-binding protein UgpC [Leclercia adecarboxylata]|uniref:sn-glycerol-3-phosphate import ATP-binding protein UgpC n=1 Tax=Leclercia adecarboxylata TaxID=83655 RepID=A0A4U9HXA7_9ENTR|nr:sn-glycerol-3-phosphate import ATP-binding protein UgpC [Leclercia adecarboxylata]
MAIPEDKLAALNTGGYQRKAVVFGIRPEDIVTPQSGHESINAKVSVAELTGAEFMLYASVGGHELVVRAGAANDYAAGDNIGIQFDMNKCHFFDAETENGYSIISVLAGNANFRFFYLLIMREYFNEYSTKKCCACSLRRG